jgi:hypothetical protein
MKQATQAEVEITIECLMGYYFSKFEETRGIDAKLHSQKCLCYLAIIDGLSGYCYPRLGNKERFIKFITEVANWHEGSLVSFIQLRAWVIQHGQSISQDLRLFLETEYDKLKSGDFYEISAIEIPLAEFITRYGDYDMFQRFTQSMLLYKYRNSLVHEALLKSGTFPFVDTSKPYYGSFYGSQTDSFSNPVPNWVLYYPEPFLENLCAISIDACSSYLRSNSIDPYRSDNNPEYWN